MIFDAPFVIDQVVLYPDDVDNGRFYYLPLAPRLAWNDDLPALSLLKYRGQPADSNTGGLLTFDVDLMVADEVLTAVKATLQKQHTVTSLVPVPPEGGLVRLSLFERTVQARPAGFGANRATFTLPLSAKETTLVEGALFGTKFLPFHLVWQQPFLLLRPAHRFQLIADWNRVYTAVKTRFNMGLVFLQLEISDLVSSLIETGAVQVIYETFTTDEEANSEKRTAFEQLKNSLLANFFEPMPQRSLEDDGSAPLLGFTRKRIELNQLDNRQTNLDMNEAQVILKEVYPQGLLTSLRAFPSLKAQVVTLIELDDAFFQTRHLTLTLQADFAGDGIERIEVELAYGSDKKMALFTAVSSPTTTVRWSAQVEQDRLVRPVTLQYTVYFANGRYQINSLTSQPEVEESNHHTINPQALYSLRTVPIVVSADYPWQRYQKIQLQLGDGHFFTLAEDNRSASWRQFLLPQSDTTFRQQIRHIGNGDTTDISLPWQEADGVVFITSPLSQMRTIRLVPQVDWAIYQEAIVELIYKDSANGLFDHQSIILTEAKTAVFQTPIKDPTQQLVAYTVRFVTHSGNIEQMPASTTTASLLLITPRMKGQRTITLTVNSADFTTFAIKQLRLNVLHHDETAGLKTEKQLVLLPAPANSATFTFEFMKERSVVVEPVFEYENGRFGTAASQSSQADSLTIQGQPLANFLNKTIHIDAEQIDWHIYKSVALTLAYEGEHLADITCTPEDTQHTVAITLSQETNTQFHYRAEAKVNSDRRRAYGSKVHWPSDDEDVWQSADVGALTLQLPDDVALAAQHNQLLVKVNAGQLDAEALEVRIAYPRTSFKKVRLSDEGQGVFLQELVEENGRFQTQYQWRATYKTDHNTHYHPGPSQRDAQPSQETHLNLEQLFTITSEANPPQ